MTYHQSQSIFSEASIDRAVIATLITNASEATGIKESQIRGRKRHKPIAAARHWVWTQAKLMGLSYPRIAKVFRRDHTTIVYGVKSYIEREGWIKPKRRKTEKG